MSTYKEYKENYVKATEVIPMQSGDIPEGNMKKYYEAILITAGDPSQGRMLLNVKTENTVIDESAPHKTSIL